MYHTVICGVSGCTVFFHIILQTAGFSTRVMKHKYVLIVSIILF